eukprot:GHVU01007291.1.p3 GENE.GHVU01007291.1~~GHVU01007291.1.p3  ORF type:complete len:107 (-),score=2.68 GHVU01007291.1:4-324(-)
MSVNQSANRDVEWCLGCLVGVIAIATRLGVWREKWIKTCSSSFRVSCTCSTELLWLREAAARRRGPCRKQIRALPQSGVFWRVLELPSDTLNPNVKLSVLEFVWRV